MTTFDDKIQSLVSGLVPYIYQDELKDRLNGNDNLVILDTRKEEEFEVSHLTGAVFINYDNFAPSLVEGLNKNELVVVYCSVGYRSEKIATKLISLGFTNVRNLYGGIFEWKNRGNMVVTSDEMATERVHTYNEDWSRWLQNGDKVY